MARFVTGSFSTATSVSTHALGVTPAATLLLVGARGPVDVLQTQVFSASYGGAVSTGAPPGVFWHHFASGGDGHTDANSFVAEGSSGSSEFGTSGFNHSFGGSSLASTSIAYRDLQSSDGLLEGPQFFAAVGGNDVLGANTSLTLTTVSTQRSTGYGFQPNVAIIGAAYNDGTSAAASFGIAAADTAGVISQWSIDVQARNASGAAVGKRSASTVSAVRLHSSASTRFDALVSSFMADGLELTVAHSDTLQTGSLGILALNVPKAALGKATVTTNGAGSGLTGFTVTGLGQLVGFVICASIGTSLQTLQEGGHLSVGFSDSAGNQRFVGGAMLTTVMGGTAFSTARFGSYRGTSHIVANMLTTVSIAAHSLGAFAVTTDGFTVTFDNTVANGMDVYWAAFINAATDLEAHILSSGDMNANLAEVTRLAAAINSSGELNAAMLTEFTPGEGKLHAHSKMETLVWQDAAQVHDRFLVSQENTSSPDINRTIDVTTTPQRLGLAELGNAKFLRILPPSTNTHPLRLAGNPTGVGMPMSSVGMSQFTLADRGGSDAYLYTTAAGTTIEGVRILLD